MKRGSASFANRHSQFEFAKRNAEEGFSPSADGEKGYAPFTAQTFEKV